MILIRDLLFIGLINIWEHMMDIYLKLLSKIKILPIFHSNRVKKANSFIKIWYNLFLFNFIFILLFKEPFLQLCRRFRKKEEIEIKIIFYRYKVNVSK